MTPQRTKTYVGSLPINMKNNLIFTMYETFKWIKLLAVESQKDCLPNRNLLFLTFTFVGFLRAGTLKALMQRPVGHCLNLCNLASHALPWEPRLFSKEFGSERTDTVKSSRRGRDLRHRESKMSSLSKVGFDVEFNRMIKTQ